MAGIGTVFVDLLDLGSGRPRFGGSMPVTTLLTGGLILLTCAVAVLLPKQDRQGEPAH